MHFGHIDGIGNPPPLLSTHIQNVFRSAMQHRGPRRSDYDATLLADMTNAIYASYSASGW